MKWELRNLDQTTREFMLKEVDLDIKQGRLYISERLNARGKERYSSLLIESIKFGDISTLTTALGLELFNSTYQRKKPKGGMQTVKMPKNAAQLLAEGEFNRFYMRALCERTIEQGNTTVRIYRAKCSEHPRAESEARVGERVNAVNLLQDLRMNIGTDTALGVPNGAGSGLSITLT